MSVAIILVALSPRGYYLYGTHSLFAFGFSIASPSLRGLISNGVADNEQGKVSGEAQSLTSLSQILGPLMAGVLTRVNTIETASRSEKLLSRHT